MTIRAKGVAVLIVQLGLVLTIGGKYAWERQHCPRVWTRTMQYDPERILRGRYLSLMLRADACGLKDGDAAVDGGRTAQGEWRGVNARQWTVVPAVRDGKLAPRLATGDRPEETASLVLRSDTSCEAAVLQQPVEYFIAEHAQQPFPLNQGEELWAEVTVPPAGPPRPVRLAVSEGKSFRVLDLK